MTTQTKGEAATQHNASCTGWNDIDEQRVNCSTECYESYRFTLYRLALAATVKRLGHAADCPCLTCELVRDAYLA